MEGLRVLELEGQIDLCLKLTLRAQLVASYYTDARSLLHLDPLSFVVFELIAVFRLTSKFLPRSSVLSFHHFQFPLLRLFYPFKVFSFSPLLSFHLPTFLFRQSSCT